MFVQYVSHLFFFFFFYLGGGLLLVVSLCCRGCEQKKRKENCQTLAVALSTLPHKSGVFWFHKWVAVDDTLQFHTRASRCCCCTSATTSQVQIKRNDSEPMSYPQTATQGRSVKKMFCNASVARKGHWLFGKRRRQHVCVIQLQIRAPLAPVAGLLFRLRVNTEREGWADVFCLDAQPPDNTQKNMQIYTHPRTLSAVTSTV